MIFDDLELLNSKQTNEIIQEMIIDGRAGFFSWEIEAQSFDVLENFTGKNYKHIDTYRDFLKRFVFEKDLEMALQDLEYYMSGKVVTYQSTFRVLDNEENINWVFCKGSMSANRIFSGIMYNVSSSNLMQGHDLKTNLMNGVTFMRKLNNAIQSAERNNSAGALMVIDINNFTTIINKYGYDFGSRLLYKMSRVLLDVVGDYDEIGHFPYDKFMVLIKNVENAEEVEKISQEIFKIFEEAFDIDDIQVYLNIQIGITIFPKISSNAVRLLRFSDFAISYSRESGDNTAVLFNSNLLASYNREMDIENELPKALIDNELYLVYQPQLNIKTNKIIGFETLIRWENQNLGFISPAEFIPIAESKGYIVAIGHWIRRESIKTARVWLDKGIVFEKMAINVSAVEFRQKNFKETLLEICKYYDIPPEMIELEMTESTLMNTNDENIKMMDNLKAEGFNIALDDFGTGYSNFSTLLNFNVNTLKLDKSLIDNNENDVQRYFLKSLIGSKDFLHYQVVAEGVENQKELDVLHELDCDIIQGFHFCRPLPKLEMEEFIADFLELNK